MGSATQRHSKDHIQLRTRDRVVGTPQPTWPLSTWLQLGAAGALVIAVLVLSVIFPVKQHRPDISDLPAYTGAYSVATRYQVMGKVTSYLVKTTPEDVFEFY